MKIATLRTVVLLASAGVLFLTGCVYRERTVYRQPGGPVVSDEVVVAGPPPPPIVEEVTVAPAPGFIWIGGCWAWHGRWVWEHGRWARPPRPGAHWVPHQYVYRNGVHVFVRGGWR